MLNKIARGFLLRAVELLTCSKAERLRKEIEWAEGEGKERFQQQLDDELAKEALVAVLVSSTALLLIQAAEKWLEKRRKPCNT